MIRAFFMATLLVAFALFALGQSTNSTPELVLKDIQGKNLKLSDYRGKVVLLNFWATWCAPCVKEIPDMIDVQKMFQDKGVQFIGASVDLEGFKDVRPFLDKHQFKLNYPIIIADHPMLNAYKNPAFLPTTFIIDRKGIIRKETVGVLSREKLASLLDEILEE